MMTEPKFFKKENNSNAAEFKRCLPVNVNTSYTTLAPAIATAEQQRLKPMIGEALFDSMAAYYAENGISGDDTNKNELVSMIQMAVVRLAYWDSFDQLSVMMSDSGLSDKNGENRAYRYQANAVKDSLLRQGFAYLNQIVGFCTDHINEFNDFMQSDYYTERQNSTIRSMKEMERVVSLNGDFFLFARLRDYIAETESMELTYRIGPSMTKQLTEHRDDARIATLLRSAQGFVAHWSMAEAVPFLNVMMSAQGPIVISEESTGSNSGKVSNAPRGEQIEALQQRHRAMAERYIGQLVTYCKQHVDTYPEIAEIGLGTDYEKTAGHRDNRNKKTFLA